MAELLQQLVTMQAERCPDAIALVMNDERISYSSLEWASNQFERLPQNGNGKIDRRALREQFQQSLSQPA